MNEPDSWYARRDQRRAQLESLYIPGLIDEFTQNPGGKGIPLTWTIDTMRGGTLTMTSREVPEFVRDVLAEAGNPRTRLSRPPGDRIPYSSLPDVYGIPMTTLRIWQTRGLFPPAILHGVRRTSTYADYSLAYAYRRDAMHWGRSTGRLLRDGTPNPVHISKSPTARAARAA